MPAFKIFSVGYEPSFASYFLGPISARTGIEFTHGVVGDSRRTRLITKTYPDCEWVPLSKSGSEPLPPPDYTFLASLESVGVPTIRSAVRGDRVLRRRPPQESLAYATLLAGRLQRALDQVKPDLVLASHDSVHSTIALAVARSRGMPWTAMTFTSIPPDLVAFCRGMTPEQLLPIERPIDDALRNEARAALSKLRSGSLRVKAIRPAETPVQRAQQAFSHARNLTRRIMSSTALGVDRFTFETINERVTDVVRRSLNRLRLPTGMMLREPPERPFVLLPLHMAPESSVDTWAPMYQNQLELATQLTLATPCDVEVVIKLHFSDPDNYSRRELQRMLQLPRLRIAHPGSSSFAFVQQAALVAGIAGTACLEAALLGKPVLLFGDSPYQHFPRSERASRPDELNSQIRRMLRLSPPSDDEIVEAFTAHIARYLPGRNNDWSRPVEDEQFDRLADCFRALRSYAESPRNREAWYQQSPFLDEPRRVHRDLDEGRMLKTRRSVGRS